jgi:hypothetical protein
MKRLFNALATTLSFAIALFVIPHTARVMAQGAVPPIAHVVLIVDENTDYADVCGPNNTSMPFLCSLKPQGSFATGYYAPTHPSVGNYEDLVWGIVSTNDDGCNPNGSGGTDCPFPYSGDNIVRELISGGKTWKAYIESLPSVCYLGGDSTAAGGQYYVRHNPIAYISDVFNSVAQCQNEVPFESSTVGFAHDLANNTLPNWVLIKPNGCDDSHDCALPSSSVPDTWLKNNVLQPLLNSGHLNPSTGDTIVIVTFDESNSDNTNGGGRIYWFMMGRNVKQNYVSNFNYYSHESLLRMMCEAAGCSSFNKLVGRTSCQAASPPCSPNGGAPGAPDMAEFFTTTPAPVASLSPAALSFARQAVNSTSPAQTTTLSNTGNAPMNITGISITGPNAGDFMQTNNCPSSLTSGSCSINVTFTPTASGSRSATVSVADNAAGSPHTVSLTGTGATGGPQTYSISGSLSPVSSGSGATVTLAGGAPVLVQSAPGSRLTGNTSGAVSFSAANTGGNTIVLFVRFGGATITSVTDNQPGGSNTYASVLGPTHWGVPPNSTDRWAQVFLAKNIVGNSPLTVAVTFSGSTTHDTYLAALEYSGVDPNNPVNATAVGTGTVGANGAPVTGNLTTTVANTKLVATSWDSNESYTATGNGSGYATDVAAGIASLSGGSGWPNLTEDRTAATTGTWNATASSQPAVVDWVIQLVALAPIATAMATADASGNYNFSNLSNGSYTVTPSNPGVMFTPASRGVTINSASVTGINFTAQGAGSGPVVSLSATNLSFGNQPVNTTSAAQTVTLTNTGNSTLTITSIVTSGDYAQTSTCGASVAASANCTISVKFTPTATGTRTGTITLTDNAAGSPQTISLSGTGQGAIASLSASSLTFTNQPVNTTSTAQTVTLTNTGNSTLTITSIVASGDYAQTSTCGASVAASANCTISVTFTPTATGTRTGTITLTDNNVSVATQTISLTGAGVSALPNPPTNFVAAVVGAPSPPTNFTVAVH